MGSCPSGELSWWGIVLVGNWGVVLVGNCASGELSWRGIVLVGKCPRGGGVVLLGSCQGGNCLVGLELSSGELSGYATGNMQLNAS